MLLATTATGAMPGGVLGTITLIASLFGAGGWLKIFIEKAMDRRRARREEERDENADDRAEIESWQKNSNQWQGQVMTLQGELAKRDEKIRHLEEDVAEMRAQLTELQARFAGVLWENRQYLMRHGPLVHGKGETP